MKPWILFRCRKCAELVIGNRSIKPGRRTATAWRVCNKCGYKNELVRVVVLQEFNCQEHASNALRYFKVPKELRGKVPYLQGTGNAARRSGVTDDEFVIFTPRE